MNISGGLILVFAVIAAGAGAAIVLLVLALRRMSATLRERTEALEREIAERTRHEQQMAENTLELQRSNAELEQFAYIASHDLQEPLRMVASYTDLLAQRYQGKLDERADKYIKYAVDGAKRMQRLIDDLLTFSRVGRRQRPLQPTDLNEIVRTVLKSLGHAIGKSNATIEFRNLPMVMADDGQIGQVFQNLIGNAIKFHAERAPHIRVAAELKAGKYLCAVADNGIGIEGQYSERIFQMFQRLHDRETYEGSGIGLAVAKKIVERHGGRIWFESEPGKGTTFFFTLTPVQEKAA
jgi:light-regulated signal transduction histidine kinase (bacteriophytochrome)